MAAGYVVTAESPQPRQYKGPAGSAWPLGLRAEARAKALVEETEVEFMKYADDGRYAPWLVSSPELARRYAVVCADLGLQVRILFCSEQQEPPAEGKLLGWDVVSPSLDYSAVDDEVAHDDSLFPDVRARLNESGLFDDAATLDEFLARRREHAVKGVNMESLEGTYRLAIYVVV